MQPRAAPTHPRWDEGERGEGGGDRSREGPPPPPRRRARRIKSAAARPRRSWLLWASQAGPSPPPDPSPRLLPPQARPSALLRSLTHDELPVRSRRSSDTGPGLGRDAYSSPGAAASARLRLWLGLGGGFPGSLVSQQLPRRTPGGGGSEQPSRLRAGTAACAFRSSLSTQVPGALGVDTVEARRKRISGGPHISLASVFLDGRTSETGKFEFSFLNSNTKSGESANEECELGFDAAS